MRRAACVRAAVVGMVAAFGPPAAAWAQPDPSQGGGGRHHGGGGGGGGDYKPVPLNLQKEQIGVASLPGVGRSRMRSGDCDGALQAFDAALRVLVDPTINRDRGLCHEQLGHVYPAIDDYRVYLTASPEAPDAEGIARRLRALEDQVAGRAPTASASDDDTPPDLGASARRSSGSAASPSASGGAGSTASDKLEYAEPDQDGLRTPLGRGKGLSLAPFFSEHKWIGGSAFSGASDGQTWSEALGVQIRYAVNRGGALVAEIGYEHFNSTSVDPVQLQGLTSLLGYELRFPLDGEYRNQMLLVPALGYEHLNVTFADGSAASQNVGGFVPRLRVGWRHMLEAGTALDVSIDGGAGSFFAYSKFPYDSTQSASGLITLNLSVAWGL